MYFLLIHSSTSDIFIYWLFQGLRRKASSIAPFNRKHEKRNWLVQSRQDSTSMRKFGKGEKVSLLEILRLFRMGF